MMAASLQLEEPWYVACASFDPEKRQMDIWVKVRDHAVFACPRCGSQAKRYGYEPYERSWRHADCLFFPCYVHCQRPKGLCGKGGLQQVNAPFERQNSRFTLMFEGYAMMILADIPRRKASRLLRCNEKSLASILSYWVNRAAVKQDLSPLQYAAALLGCQIPRRFKKPAGISLFGSPCLPFWHPHLRCRLRRRSWDYGYLTARSLKPTRR